MGDYAARFPGQLSGGQQQRIALASALIMPPRPIPAGAHARGAEAPAALKIAFLHVMHAQDMDGGWICQIGTPAEVFEHSTRAFVARFIRGHNVPPWKCALIAVRSDRCAIARPGAAHAWQEGSAWD